MAYNNYFPMNYQQQYYPQQQPQQQMPMMGQQAQSQPVQQANSSIIWVQGEAGAKSYLVAPNNTVQLWDSEDQVIYLKSADASGMPSMKILDYKIREASQPAQPQVMSSPEYVTREELAAFGVQIKKEVKSLLPKKRKVEVEEVDEDE